MQAKPLFEVRGRADKQTCRLKLFADRIELYKPKFIGSYLAATIRYEHVASVTAQRGFLASALQIETSGGGRLVVDMLMKPEAEQFVAIVNERTAAARSAMFSAPAMHSASAASASGYLPPPFPMPSEAVTQRGVVAQFTRAVMWVVIGFVLILAIGIGFAIYNDVKKMRIAPSAAPVAQAETVVDPQQQPATEMSAEIEAIQAPAPVLVRDVAYEEIERIRTPYLTIVVKTDAKSEVEVRQVVDRYRRASLKAEKVFQMRLYLESAKRIPPLRDTLDGTAGKTWQRELVAIYTFNQNSGVDEISMYIETPNELNIEGLHAVELIRDRMHSIQIAAVVRVDRLTPDVAMKVGMYYESLAHDVDSLHVYLTDSQEKWSEYPKVYPASVPSQVRFVYTRGPRAPGKVVKGSEFE